jgi:hypothetical protein
MFMGLSGRQIGGVALVSLGVMLIAGWVFKPAAPKEK